MVQQHTRHDRKHVAVNAAEMSGQNCESRNAVGCWKHYSPATGHPQATQITAKMMTLDGCLLSTPLAAPVSMYMAKLLGNKLVAEMNMPVLVARKKRKRLPHTPPVSLATKLHSNGSFESTSMRA